MFKNFLLFIIGKINKIKIDIINAITPPNLLGIARKIEYENKKYHSGWIWLGVIIGFAIIKLLWSFNIYGNINAKIKNNHINIIKPIISLIIKYGENLILSKFLLIPKGLFDPVKCKKNKCKIENIKIIKGKIKWIEKNRVRVALLIENPPQIQITIEFPKYGMADNKFVITVAPQKDIWPHGKTYPTKAVIIVNSNKITPIIHVILKLNEFI